MAIFHCYVSSPEGTCCYIDPSEVMMLWQKKNPSEIQWFLKKVICRQADRPLLDSGMDSKAAVQFSARCSTQTHLDQATYVVTLWLRLVEPPQTPWFLMGFGMILSKMTIKLGLIYVHMVKWLVDGLEHIFFLWLSILILGMSSSQLC